MPVAPRRKFCWRLRARSVLGDGMTPAICVAEQASGVDDGCSESPAECVRTVPEPRHLDQATDLGCNVVSAAPGGPDATVAILVVEDDPSVGELITTVLNDVSGWSATVAPDAAVARAAFQQVVIKVLS